MTKNILNTTATDKKFMDMESLKNSVENLIGYIKSGTIHLPIKFTDSTSQSSFKPYKTKSVSIEKPGWRKEKETKQLSRDKNEVSINFLGSSLKDTISNHTMGVLQNIMHESGNASITITSTTRKPEDQARIMFENISKYGVKKQKELYGKYGDMVIDKYPSLSSMIHKIIELGPEHISKHCGEPTKINVIDIAPSSIRHRKAFEKAIRNNHAVSRFFFPPSDPAYHLEIPQL
jgi:hypothetical protein